MEGGIGRADDTLHPEVLLALTLVGMAMGLQPACPQVNNLRALPLQVLPMS